MLVKKIRKKDLRTENDVKNSCRLALQHEGHMVWRNNVGALTDKQGRLVRFGLGNDSHIINRILKSSDLIGICDNGLMLAIECKAPYWYWRGDEREQAQLNFILLIRARGGRAGFATHPGQAIAIAKGESHGASTPLNRILPI